MQKKQTLIIGLFCALGFVSIAQAASLKNIDGIYTCSVTDKTLVPSVHTTGKFSLKNTGNVYSVEQLDVNTNQPVANENHIFGLRAGNVLSLAFQNIKDPTQFGSEIMRISQDGKTLQGTFIYWGKFDKKNVEVCKRD